MQVQARATISIPFLFGRASWYIHRQHDMNVYIHFMGFHGSANIQSLVPWIRHGYHTGGSFWFLVWEGGRLLILFDVFATFFWVFMYRFAIFFLRIACMKQKAP